MKAGAQKGLPFVIDSFLLRENVGMGGECLLVAVSGGPDSVCLLHALSELREHRDLNLHVAHLNHGLRGTDSDSDGEYVVDLCAGLSVPVTVEVADVIGHKKANRMSTEESARNLRLEFFSRVAVNQGASVVVTGHTADDQAETILMHMIRGSGLVGLRGMEPLVKLAMDKRKTLMIGRPLLGTWRKETETYCSFHDLAPRQDSMNSSMNYSRNRVRLDLIPSMEKLNPSVKQSIIRLSENVTEGVSLLEHMVENAWSEVARVTKLQISFQKTLFEQLPRGLEGILLRKGFRHLLGKLDGFEQVHTQNILEFIRGNNGTGSIDLPHGLIFEKSYSDFRLRQGDIKSSNLACSEVQQLNIPGVTALKDWVVETCYESNLSADKMSRERFTACLDADMAGPNLSVRNWRKGDRFQPLGLIGSKKLQDFFVDAKVPKNERGKVPLVFGDTGILWVVGHQVSDIAKIRPQTKQGLTIRFGRS